MPQTRVRQYRAVTTCFAVDQQIATIRIRGAVSPAAGAGILTDCDADLLAWQPAALVARYDEAELKLDAESLFESANKVLTSSSALRLPTALVVKPDDLPMWRVYSNMQCANGVLRVPFTDATKAARWAEDQAALWRAQITYLLRAR